MIFYCQNIWNNTPASYRNTLVRSLAKEVDADVCFFQECGPKTNRVAKKAIQDLMADVYTEACPEVAATNFTPVFYKKDKFNLIDNGYFLYDGLNDEDSKSVTWAVLEDKSTSETVVCISTHFWWMFDSEKDNQQRLQNVEQLKEICDELDAKYGYPIVIGGDFNNGKNSVQGDMPYKTMLQKGFADIRLCAEETTETYTHHEYPILQDDETYVKSEMPDKNIDFIFIYGKNRLKPKKFDVLISDDALASSDHCPLVGYFE